MTEDPLALFDAWFAEAKASEPNDPEAMALATADSDGRPSVRMVLLKGHDRSGFTFFTNRQSDKASDLADNANAALLFHWKSLRRQVRLSGPVTPVEESTADEYFATRSRESQLGAWASDQSRPLPDRATFERRIAEAAKRFDGRDVPRPPYWGGYKLVPERIEFWEDRPGRLHHRRLFVRNGDNWEEGLLYP